MSSSIRTRLSAPEVHVLPSDHPYGGILAAARTSLGGESARLLITVFVSPDAPGVLVPLLQALQNIDADAQARLGVRTFNVEASLSASLSGIAVLALVIEPVRADRDAVTTLTSELRGEVYCLLKNVLDTHVTGPSEETSRVMPRELEEGGTAGRPKMVTSRFDHHVNIIQPANDFRLYAGREFREVRFGLRPEEEGSAALATRVLSGFSAALAKHDIPIAYMHYPQPWGSEGLDWLRVAYAVDRHGDQRVAAEMAAWGIAKKVSVPAFVYEPRLPAASLSGRFAPVYKPDSEPSRGFVSDEPDHLGLCIEGMARPGLVAEILSQVPDVRIYGCTMSVMYGHTVCNLTTDRIRGLELEQVIAKHLTVQSYPVDWSGSPVTRASAANAEFWVAWYAPEAVGLMGRVIESVYAFFQEEDYRRPNMEYAISRVVAEGYACAGKIRFVCRQADAVALGLGALGSPVGSGGTGRAELTRLVSDAVVTLLEQNSVSEARRSAVSVKVLDAEPDEGPWAALVVPEGSHLSSQGAAD